MSRPPQLKGLDGGMSRPPQLKGRKEVNGGDVNG